MNFKNLGLLAAVMFLSFQAYSQNDTLRFNNGNDVIVGEIKEMTRGVITIETDYSDSDFKIEWEKVTEVRTDQLYTVALRNRTILTRARIQTIEPGRLRILSEDEGVQEVAVTDIVNLRQLDSSFWSKLSANVDIGYSVTKQNNLQQYNANAGIGYKTDRWILNSTYSQVRSEQDDVAPTDRMDASIRGDYQFRNSFFTGAAVNFLSNNEQLLNLRTTAQAGGGYYFVRSVAMYWNGFAGVAYNNEDYDMSPENPDMNNDRTSYEGVLGTELNMYDIGDLNFFMNVYWYPSFTEENRHRADFKMNVKYDLPLDFYISGGVTVNYDNEPVQGAADTDYVIQTGFGWEL